jgi:hypothetical protein
MTGKSVPVPIRQEHIPRIPVSGQLLPELIGSANASAFYRYQSQEQVFSRVEVPEYAVCGNYDFAFWLVGVNKLRIFQSCSIS